MKSLLIVSLPLFLLTAIVVALSLRKRFAKPRSIFVGEIGHTETALDPDGSIVLNGEVWRARSADGHRIASLADVRVVAVDRLDVLVESF